MRLTLVLALAVAALGGALLATALGQDGDADGEVAPVVVQQPTEAAQPEPTGQAAQQAQETPSADREGDRPSRRDRASRERQTGTPRYVEPEDRLIGRQELARARNAAVRAVGSGTVTDIDRSDDRGVAFEVELVQNGRDVDVRLDRNLDLVATDYND